MSEQRVARLEVDMHKVTTVIKGLPNHLMGPRTDMAELKGRVPTLQGHRGLIIVLGAFLTVISAVVGGGLLLIGPPLMPTTQRRSAAPGSPSVRLSGLDRPHVSAM